jgi:hypothetical protein
MIDEQFLATVPRYGIGGLVGKFFKKVKKVVKKVAPIVGGGIGFMIGGAAGAGIGAGIGGLIAGQDVEKALQTAMLGYGIGSVAGSFGPFQQFAGKGIGGKMAWNPSDKGNLFNIFKGGGAEGKIEKLTAENASLQGLAEQGNQVAIDQIATNTAAMEQLKVNEIIKGGGLFPSGASSLGNTMTLASLGLPYAAYAGAKADQENFQSPDPNALNALYYADPQAFQIAGQRVKPYYYEDLQDQFGVPIADLPTDFVRSAKGGEIQKYNQGSPPIPHLDEKQEVPYDEMQKDQMMGYLMFQFSENPSAFEQRFGNEMAEFFRQMMGHRSKEQYSQDMGAVFDDNSSEVIGWNLAQGGTVKLANGSEQYFPRKNGQIDGPGTGTSDDIPAMLSDGEFVFTAEAVRNAGGGNRREGAKRMYQVMKNLENNGTLSNQSRGMA